MAYELIPLFSGSSGNASLLRCGDTTLLIDAGVSCKRLEDAASRLGTSLDAVTAVLITHEHSDHVKGLEMLCKRHRKPVYICEASFEAMKAVSPTDQLASCVSFLEPGEGFTVGEIGILPFKTPHDAFASVGFRFTLSDGTSVGYATDIGYITRGIASALAGCETVLLESNHDEQMLITGPYPYYLKERILSDKGHLSNRACAAFLPHLYANGTKKVILAHLSEHNNTPEKAYVTGRTAIEQNGLDPARCKLTVARKGLFEP